jgi:hypothetical protein
MVYWARNPTIRAEEEQLRLSKQVNQAFLNPWSLTWDKQVDDSLIE